MRQKASNSVSVNGCSEWGDEGGVNEKQSRNRKDLLLHFLIIIFTNPSKDLGIYLSDAEENEDSLAME